MTETNEILEIFIGEKKQKVCFNPAFAYDKRPLLFREQKMGESREYVGKIYHVTNLNAYEKKEDIVAVYYSGEIVISELKRLKNKGVQFLIGSKKFFFELFDEIDLPYLLWDEGREVEDLIERECTLDIRLTINFKMFDLMKMEQGDVFYDKSLDVVKIEERVKHSLYQILNLTPAFKFSEFDIYYFSSIEQLKCFTGMDSTFAYKDKMVFLIYSQLHNNAEIHEMLHVFLNKLGDPPFLLKEGFPSLGYELCSNKRFNRYLCNIYMKNRLLKELPYKTIDCMIDQVVSDRKYDGGDYYTAASFLHWIILERGIDTIVLCYKKLKRENKYAQNRALLEQMVGMKLEEMISCWHQKLTL